MAWAHSVGWLPEGWANAECGTIELVQSYLAQAAFDAAWAAGRAVPLEQALACGLEKVLPHHTAAGQELRLVRAGDTRDTHDTHGRFGASESDTGGVAPVSSVSLPPDLGVAGLIGVTWESRCPPARVRMGVYIY